MKDQIINMRRKLGELASEMSAVSGKIAAVLSAAEAANEGKGRSLTDEEATTIKGLREEYTSLRGREDQLRAAIEMAEETASRELATATPLRTGAPLTTHDNAEDRPWGKDLFGGFGAFLRAVRHATPEEGIIDPRLRRHTMAGPTGGNETVGSEGGFLLAPEVSAYITKRLFETGILAPRCGSLTLPPGVTRYRLQLNGETSRVKGSRWGGVRVYWRAEADTVSASKPKLREVLGGLQALMGICYATGELEDDTIYGQVMAQAFPEEMAAELDECIYSGTGVGKPLGFSSSAACITQSKEDGQEAASVYYENCLNMWSRLPAGARADAIWLMHQMLEPKLGTMVMPGLNGGPVYLPPGGASVAPYGTLFGRPVIPFEHCAAPGSLGDLVLFSPSWYLLIGNGENAKMDMSMHVRFVYLENCYRWTLMVNGLPFNHSVITLPDGTNTVSPYVKLEARS